MGRPGPRTVALRTKILEVIASAEQPLPTPEIFVRLADRGRYCNGPKGRACPDWAGRGGGIYQHCPAWCWETPGPLGPQVRPQLAALERAGLISRVHYPNSESIMRAVDDGTLLEHIATARPRCVFWQSVEQNDEYFSAAVDAGVVGPLVDGNGGSSAFCLPNLDESTRVFDCIAEQLRIAR